MINQQESFNLYMSHYIYVCVCVCARVRAVEFVCFSLLEDISDLSICHLTLTEWYYTFVVVVVVLVVF